MIFPFSRHGDAHVVAPQASSAVADSIMVATTDGFPVYGSYPFVSSLPEESGPVNFGHPWRILPVRGGVDPQAAAVSADMQLWKRNEVARYPTMPYKSHASSYTMKTRECAPYGDSIRRTEKTKKASKRYHRHANERTMGAKKHKKCNKHTVNEKFSFKGSKGAKTLETISIHDLEDLIKKELELKVLPALHVMPSVKRDKHNREIVAAYRKRVARELSHEIKSIVEAIGPANLAHIALKNNKGRQVINRMWSARS